MAATSMMTSPNCAGAPLDTVAAVPTFGLALPFSPAGSIQARGSVCFCGSAPRRIQVVKTGPNNGRFFWACPNDRESQCKFFVWDSPLVQTVTAMCQNPQCSQLGTFTLNVPPMCECGYTKSVFTVKKDGPRKGKRIYVCPLPEGMQCPSAFEDVKPESGKCEWCSNTVRLTN
jgi:hypothetical protein